MKGDFETPYGRVEYRFAPAYEYPDVTLTGRRLTCRHRFLDVSFDMRRGEDGTWNKLTNRPSVLADSDTGVALVTASSYCRKKVLPDGVPAVAVTETSRAVADGWRAFIAARPEMFLQAWREFQTTRMKRLEDAAAGFEALARSARKDVDELRAAILSADPFAPVERFWSDYYARDTPFRCRADAEPAGGE